jgi:hypothetical protein
MPSHVRFSRSSSQQWTQPDRRPRMCLKQNWSLIESCLLSPRGDFGLARIFLPREMRVTDIDNESDQVQ